MKIILTGESALYIANTVKGKNNFLYKPMIAFDVEDALNQIQLRIQSAAYKGLTSIEFSLVKLVQVQPNYEYSCFGLGEMLEISKALGENGFKSSFEASNAFGEDCFDLHVSWAAIHTPFI